jgi:DNA-binding transcriptional regulator YdaS (Cro superfamily)
MSDGESTAQSILRHALIAAGSSKKLAQLLEVRAEDLSAYLRGERPIPQRVSETAIEVAMKHD